MKSKCTHPHCKSDLPGIWEPILLLWPEKPSFIPFQPASVNVLGHALCYSCIKTAKPVDFVPSLSEWIKIQNYFDENKKARPSFRTAKLTFMIPETRIIGGDRIV